MGSTLSGICGSKEKISSPEQQNQSPGRRTSLKPMTEMERNIHEKWGIESPQNTELVNDSPETFGATSPKS